MMSDSNDTKPSALNSADAQQSQVGSIDQVAGQYIKDLYQNQHVRLFHFELPPGADLPDHSTGPRVIVLLNDLTGERIKDNSAITGKSNQAFYLTNTFSAGFRNVAEHSASYLVLSFVPEKLSDQGLVCPENFQSITEESPVPVCLSLKNQVLTSSVNTGSNYLVFNQSEQQVHKASHDQQVQIRKGDWLFIVPATGSSSGDNQ